MQIQYIFGRILINTAKQVCGVCGTCNTALMEHDYIIDYVCHV